MKTFFLFFLLISNPAFARPSDHLQVLKSKYPYGLIGDDYGILSIQDLALNACHFDPIPFAPNSLNPYQHWQCFENKKISLSCEDIDSIPDYGGPAARVVVNAVAGNTTHQFIESRPWPLGECRSFLKSLRVIMKGTTHSCISGYNFGAEENKNGIKESIAMLGRFKTRRGCEGQECELTEKIKREYCAGKL